MSATRSIPPASTEFYLNLKMSSAFTVGVPSLNGVYKADKSLKIVYESLTVDEYGGKGVYQIDRGANLTDSVCATNRPVSAPFGNLAGGSFVKLDSAESVEEDIVPNLKNGNCYSIQFLQWDKYNFATLASHGLSNTPEKLKTVLEKKSCFLLTAGFGGGHFLVDYFRRFRDQTLSGFFLGKKFIEFYEWAAPKATDTILQTPLLAATIRGDWLGSPMELWSTPASF